MDIDDVRQMIDRRLIDPKRLLEFFEMIASQLYKYPAIDPRTFQKSVEKVVAENLK